MPTLEVSRKDLEGLTGIKIRGRAELEELLMYAKAELEGTEGDTVKIDEKDTNRPDLWSVEGIAREIKAKKGKSRGLPHYRTGRSGLTVRIEKSVKGVRPFTAGAVVRGVNITDELLKQLIQLQEKVDGTHGRKRKEAATGIYDYSRIKGDIRYYGAKPGEKKFIPLDFRAEMDLDEIIEMHPKGREYGHLLKGKKRYPVFEDSQGNVLSMPPIINSAHSGKVTKGKKDLFVEVSGFNRETISTSLKVMVMALADRGGKIETVTIVEPDGKRYVTPSFGTRKLSFSTGLVNSLSGLGLPAKQIALLVEKSGMKAVVKGNKITAEYPDYRIDIMHPVDIVEDIIIGYGYNRIEPLPISLHVYGGEQEHEKRKAALAEVCTGIGLQEVITFTLTSKEKQAGKVLLSPDGIVEIRNPISLNWALLRRNIFPELLEFLAKNKDAEYPQKIFDIGSTLRITNTGETGVEEKDRLCIVLSGRSADFTTIKSVLESISSNTGTAYEIRESSEPFLEEGKAADIYINGKKAGFMGEINRKVMLNFTLKMPVAVLETDILP
jgi:phenylalanyl-tRNA synthetase beta chain